MKKCFLFAVILLAAGCFAPDPALQKEWAPADRTYDSLARQLESSQDARNGGELLAKLRTRRNQLPDNPVLGWRTRYWEARALVPQGRWDEALELLRDAERQVDPARYPYDRIRIVGLQSQIRLMRGEYPDSYRGYCETDEYYRRTGDTLRLASTCVNMGVIMQELEDWQRALDYFKAADSLFTLSGTDTYYVKNRLNFANVLYRQGERKRAVGILDTLLRTPECLADTSFRINVLLSYCSYAEGDERGGEAAEAYRLARLSDDRKLIAKSAVALAIERLQRDSAAEALPLLRQALDYVEASDDAEFLLPSLENTAHALYATGQADSAYRTLSRFSAARDSLGADRRLAEVRLMENRAAIEQYETRLTYLHERATWQLRLTLLIVITVVCIAAFICYAFRARRDRERLLNQLHEAENKELNTRLAHERLRSEQYRREVDLRNRELADRVMAINSYNRVLEELRQKIEQEQHEGHLPAQIGIRLQQSIRRHQTHPDEENAFSGSTSRRSTPAFWSGSGRRIPILRSTSCVSVPICAWAWKTKRSPISVPYSPTALRSSGSGSVKAGCRPGVLTRGFPLFGIGIRSQVRFFSPGKAGFRKFLVHLSAGRPRVREYGRGSPDGKRTHQRPEYTMTYPSSPCSSARPSSYLSCWSYCSCSAAGRSPN